MSAHSRSVTKKPVLWRAGFGPEGELNSPKQIQMERGGYRPAGRRQ
jgi:hypothetical protein